MIQKDFLDLLTKFEKGKCSEKEKDILFDLYSKLQKNDRMDSWEMSQKEEARIRLLLRINKTIADSETIGVQKTNWKRLGGVAAVFIGFLTIGMIYLNRSIKRNPIPFDAITLELGNGTIKILEDENVSISTDRKGNVLIEQKGSRLVYSSQNKVKKLVYNTLRVPNGKTFELKLSDGTTVFLNAGSSFKYPVQFLEGLEREVFITGEAYLDVAKDAAHPFVVNANKLNIRVLGTQFNIMSYQEDNTVEIVLVEGIVSLYDNSEKYDLSQATLLKSGYRAIFSEKNKEIQVSPVITSVYTSWRNGELVFRDMTFDNMLKKLERHYGLTIINKNSELSNKVFNASFGSVSYEKVLEELKEVYGISYSIDNEVIIIQ